MSDAGVVRFTEDCFYCRVSTTALRRATGDAVVTATCTAHATPRLSGLPIPADEQPYPEAFANALSEAMERWDNEDDEDAVFQECAEHNWNLSEFLALALVRAGWTFTAPPESNMLSTVPYLVESGEEAK